MRIDKFVSEQAGISRSDAKALIKRSGISVNGAPIKSADTKIDPEKDKVTVNGRETAEEIENKIEKTVKRSGIVLDDVDIVRALSNDFSAVPAKLKKDGTLYSRSSSKRLYSKEDFEELKSVLHNSLKGLASNVFCGKMDIAPSEIENIKTEPCKYCKLGDICRSKKEETEEIDDAED